LRVILPSDLEFNDNREEKISIIGAEIHASGLVLVQIEINILRIIREMGLKENCSIKIEHILYFLVKFSSS